MRLHRYFNEPQVSAEGFTDIFGDIWRDFKHGKKEKIEANHHPDIVRKKLKETYLNEAWLSKRRLVTGEVTIPANKNGGLLVGNYKVNLRKLVDQLEANVSKNQAVVNRLYTALKPSVDLFKSGQWKDEAKASKLYQNSPVKRVGIEWPKTPDPDGINEAATVPALDAKGVVECANLIHELVTDNIEHTAFDGVWNDSLYEKQNGFRKPIFDKRSPLLAQIHDHNSDSDAERLFYDVIDYIAIVEKSYRDESDHDYLVSEIMTALVAYIDASVK